MRIAARHLPLLAAMLGVAACSSGGDAPAPKMAAESQVSDPVLGNHVKSGDNFDDDYGRMLKKYGADNNTLNADGSSNGKAGKQFAGFNRDNPEFKGKWDNKEFKAGDYHKKSWWGDKDYTKKVYSGNTDGSRFQKDSGFGGKSANEGAMAAREGGESYGTKDYHTGRAREEGGNQIEKISDAETDERRHVFTKPDIIPWEQQNLTVEDTKRMLGKDKDKSR
jgi:hypothetical protein